MPTNKSNDYTRGNNDAFDNKPKEENCSEAYERGYEDAQKQIALDNFRDWYAKYKKDLNKSGDSNGK